ncbi:YecR family lipoprotein [Kluyvera sp. 142486]|uniref:YecR family lipoprotein n=1 Tax=Kluyvera sp. 142486 TaxID=3390050 RepID=UPI00398174C5
MVGGSKADGYVTLESDIYNYYTTTPDINSPQVLSVAAKRCAMWGFHGQPDPVGDHKEVDIPFQGMKWVQSYQCSE